MSTPTDHDPFPAPDRAGVEALARRVLGRDIIAQQVRGALLLGGLALLVTAGVLVHLALGLAVAGAGCLWLGGVGGVRRHRGEDV